LVDVNLDGGIILIRILMKYGCVHWINVD
jgi:hypothetical protein